MDKYFMSSSWFEFKYTRSRIFHYNSARVVTSCDLLLVSFDKMFVTLVQNLLGVFSGNNFMNLVVGS